jgi:Ser/Thr protein kinase RdoA (MazF antagonist)
MDQIIFTHAAYCYGVAVSQFKPLSGGHFSDVYEFSKDNRAYVLRIVPPNEEIDLQAMNAILVWTNFLSGHGASVAKPVLSQAGQLVELFEQDHQPYLIVVSTKAKGILAETLPFEQWNPALFERLGRTVGKIHAIARQYIPTDESLRRPDWHAIGNCFNPDLPLDPSEKIIREKQAALLSRVKALPKDETSYGLVHADLHAGNYSIDLETGTITLFDFDDCAYGWYVMDIAMNLFDLVVLYPGADKDEFARGFLADYLKGYLAENPLDPFWLRQLPQFLKLLEMGVYAQLYRFHDPANQSSWAGRFMIDRKSRIEQDIPYVGLNFEKII